MYEYSWQLALLSYSFYFVMLIIASPYKNYLSRTRLVNQVYLNIFFFFYMILNVFSFWEYDTYHSWEQFLLYGSDITGYENIYHTIAEFVNGDYFLWRFLVWVPACLFIYLTARKLELLNNKFLVSIVLFGGFIGYTRGMIGFTMLIFGLVLLIDDNRVLKKLLGLCLIVGSYFFHKSMFVAILFSILALFPFKKNILTSLVFGFPLLAIFTTIFVLMFGDVLSSAGLSDGVGEAGENSVNSALSYERETRNTIGMLMKLFEVIPQYATLFYMAKLIYKEKILNNVTHEKTYKYLFRFTFIGFYVASLFFFTDFSAWIYERFKHIAFFAMIFVFAAVIGNENIHSKFMRNIVVLQLSVVFTTIILRISSNM